MKLSAIEKRPKCEKCRECSRADGLIITEEEMEQISIRDAILEVGLKKMGLSYAHHKIEDEFEAWHLGAMEWVDRYGSEYVAAQIRFAFGNTRSVPPWCETCLANEPWEEYYLQKLKADYQEGKRQS